MPEPIHAAAVLGGRDDVQRTAGPVLPTPRQSPDGSTTPPGDVSAVHGAGAQQAGVDYPGVRYAMQQLALRGLLGKPPLAEAPRE